MRMRFKLPRGTRDILPDEIHTWRWIEDVVHRVFRLYGYEEIRTPLFEVTHLFERGMGEETEVVSKQMYRFFDKKGREFALRPEGTAGIVRAYLEHNLGKRPSPVQLYYIGPMFRYERPQAGRQREFWQFGCELFGNLPPARDAELIQMVLYIFDELGLRDLETIINSVGCNLCRPGYTEVIRRYFKAELDSICNDCRIRVEMNPLRILDCKRDVCHSISSKAPLIQDYLCNGCSSHMERIMGLLDHLGIDYTVNPRLVRGLDYYTKTVFEIVDPRLGAKDAIAAGGRYDDLVENFGGPPTPALGFAAGIERLIISLRKLGIEESKDVGVDLYITAISDDAIETVLRIGRDLRKIGIRTKTGYKERSLKKEVVCAARLGARFLIIMGPDELSSRVVRPKDILAHKELDPVSIDKIVQWSKEAFRR